MVGLPGGYGDLLVGSPVLASARSREPESSGTDISKHQRILREARYSRPPLVRSPSSRTSSRSAGAVVEREKVRVILAYQVRITSNRRSTSGL
jgi:hypothetical protein